VKALVCKAWGPVESLVLEEVASPTAGPKQVLIDVKAAGVNFPDALMVQGKYQVKPPLPFSPGGELAGIVREIGEGVTHVKPGDEVVALAMHGAFAEEAAVAADRVIALPKGTNLEVAAAFMLAHGTSYHALKDRARLQRGETLLVLGASGGVGLAAVELGKILGARVIAAASSDAKLALCREYGADATINYSTEDLKERAKELTEGRGVDVIYDPVGGAYSEPALRTMAWGGRFLVIGFATGDIPKIPLNLTLLKGCSIVGVFWGEFTRREAKLNAANIRQLVEWLEAGTVKPHISARYPLARGADALRDVLDRKVTGKVVVLPEA
jgi:NADPH2:quinone reductase